MRKDKSEGRNIAPDAEGPHYSARDVRGGEIILRTRRWRMIFFGGLIGFVVLALVFNFARIW